MGFLKFLKKEKKEDELDLPPAPPPLEGFDELELPEMPDIEKISAPDDFKFDMTQEQQPKVEEHAEEPLLEMPQERELPEMPESHEMDFSDHNIPEFDSQPVESEQDAPIQQEQEIEEQHFLGQEEPHPLEKEPRPLLEESQQPEVEHHSYHPHHARRLFSHQKEHRILPKGKSIYVRVDKFKATLGNINTVRKDLKKADDALMKMEDVKASKDKSFERLRSSLDDLQKRLIFIDKTLFKGD